MLSIILGIQDACTLTFPTILHAVQSPCLHIKLCPCCQLYSMQFRALCLDISCANVINMTGDLVVMFSAALTADGTVWTWGSNTDCQLGRPAQEGSASDPNCPRAVAGPEAAHTGTTYTSLYSLILETGNKNVSRRHNGSLCTQKQPETSDTLLHENSAPTAAC